MNAVEFYLLKDAVRVSSCRTPAGMSANRWCSQQSVNQQKCMEQLESLKKSYSASLWKMDSLEKESKWEEESKCERNQEFKLEMPNRYIEEVLGYASLGFRGKV